MLQERARQFIGLLSGIGYELKNDNEATLLLLSALIIEDKDARDRAFEKLQAKLGACIDLQAELGKIEIAGCPKWDGRPLSLADALAVCDAFSYAYFRVGLLTRGASSRAAVAGALVALFTLLVPMPARGAEKGKAAEAGYGSSPIAVNLLATGMVSAALQDLSKRSEVILSDMLAASLISKSLLPADYPITLDVSLVKTVNLSDPLEIELGLFYGTAAKDVPDTGHGLVLKYEPFELVKVPDSQGVGYKAFLRYALHDLNRPALSGSEEFHCPSKVELALTNGIHPPFGLGGNPQKFLLPDLSDNPLGKYLSREGYAGTNPENGRKYSMRMEEPDRFIFSSPDTYKAFGREFQLEGVVEGGRGAAWINLINW